MTNYPEIDVPAEIIEEVSLPNHQEKIDDAIDYKAKYFRLLEKYTALLEKEKEDTPKEPKETPKPINRIANWQEARKALERLHNPKFKKDLEKSNEGA